MSLIYVVEDDKNIQEIEQIALKNSGYQVVTFDTAGDFFDALKTQTPDLLLLDIMLPDMDGLQVLEQVRGQAALRSLPIIMVTAKTTELDKVRGLDMGADDYLSKPFGIMELISRVKALLRRSGGKREKNITIGQVCLDEEKHKVTVDGQACELTYKEYELLKLLMANAGVVTSRESILEQVWGTDFEGESRTLDMHIKTLRQKLGASGGMIKTVRNVGYILICKDRWRDSMKRKINSRLIETAALAILATLLLMTAVYYHILSEQVMKDLKSYADVADYAVRYDQQAFLRKKQSC